MPTSLELSCCEEHEEGHPDSSAQAILEHYRCPSELLQIALRGELSRGSGFFRFGNAVCYGRSSSGTRRRSPNTASCSRRSTDNPLRRNTVRRRSSRTGTNSKRIQRRARSRAAIQITTPARKLSSKSSCRNARASRCCHRLRFHSSGSSTTQLPSPQTAICISRLHPNAATATLTMCRVQFLISPIQK